MMPSARLSALRPRAALVPALLAALLASTAPPARAAISCTVTSSGVVFGSYDTFSSPAGRHRADPDRLQRQPVVQHLPEHGRQRLVRAARHGQRRLPAELQPLHRRRPHHDPSNGTGGSQVVSGTSAKPVVDATVYGRVPARQNAVVGN